MPARTARVRLCRGSRGVCWTRASSEPSISVEIRLGRHSDQQESEGAQFVRLEDEVRIATEAKRRRNLV